MNIKNVNNFLIKSILAIAVYAFASCASSQKIAIDPTAPIVIESPYYQKWIGGVQGSGYGFTLYFPVEISAEVQLQHAYFAGKKIKLSYQKSKNLYVGRYTNPSSVQSTKPDIIMDADPEKEFGNQLPPEKEPSIPFELKKGECIVAYLKNGKKGFFRIQHIPEKPVKAYPMQRPQGKL